MIPLIASVSGLLLTDKEKRFFANFKPAGVAFFPRNIASKTQLQNLISEIKNAVSNAPMLFCIDQEGGRVRRLCEPNFDSYVSQYVLGKLPVEASKLHASLICADFIELGLNMNFAPVLDILHEDKSAVIGSRSFGKDEKIAASHGQVMIEEYLANGVCPCIKHLPGHGATVSDSHLSLPVINKPLQELEQDFYPFIQNANAPAGMTAHIIVADIDDQKPVTLSAKAIKKLIRDLIGFDGLLITDALEMKALQGNIADLAQDVIEAGCDLALYGGGNIQILEQIAAKIPVLQPKSYERLEKIFDNLRAKSQDNLFQNLKSKRQKYLQMTGTIEPYDDTYDMTMVLEKMKNSD